MATNLANQIVRLDADGAIFAARLGVRWALGDTAEKEDLQLVAQAMAEALITALVEQPLPPVVADLFVTVPIANFGKIDGVMLSGGVAEYVYGREKRDFGDLGWRLGRALRRLFDEGACPWPLLPPGECIRATALGASEYSVQMSGQTIYISDHAALLPKRNLQVLFPPFEFTEGFTAEDLGAAIVRHREAFDLAAPDSEFALAFRWRGAPDYPRLRALGEGIAAGLKDRLAAGAPLYVMLEGDAALSLGALMRSDLGIANEVLVVDGIVLRDFDFVDIGRVRLPSCTVPITIKSLFFGTRAG